MSQSKELGAISGLSAGGMVANYSAVNPFIPRRRLQAMRMLKPHANSQAGVRDF